MKFCRNVKRNPRNWRERRGKKYESGKHPTITETTDPSQKSQKCAELHFSEIYDDINLLCSSQDVAGLSKSRFSILTSLKS